MKKIFFAILFIMAAGLSSAAAADTAVDAYWSVSSVNSSGYVIKSSENGGKGNLPALEIENIAGENVILECKIPEYMIKGRECTLSFYYKASGITDYEKSVYSVMQGDAETQKTFSNKSYWLKATATPEQVNAGEKFVFKINLAERGMNVKISDFRLTDTNGETVYSYDYTKSAYTDWQGWTASSDEFEGRLHKGGGTDGKSDYITISKISEEKALKSVIQTIPLSKLKRGETYTLSYDYFGNNLDFDKWGNVEHTNQNWVQSATYLGNTDEWKHIEKDITLTNSADLNVMFRMRSKNAAVSIANLKLTKKGDSKNILFNSDFSVYGFEKLPQMSGYEYNSETGMLTWERPDNLSGYYNISVYCENVLKGVYNSFSEAANIGTGLEKIVLYTEDLTGNKSEGKTIISGDENYNLRPFYLKSSSAYTFTFKGKEYILLDAGSSNSSKFMVMCKDIVKVRSFDNDNTQKFDSEDSNNLAYYLNNTMLSEGVLPDEIINAVDNSHVWQTEAGYSGGNCPEAYSGVMGIAVLSENEYLKYKDKIGVVDDFYGKYSAWWLRTGEKNNALIKVLRFSASYYDMIARWDSKEWCAVRPVFYLNRSFFVNNSVENMGEGVKKILCEEYAPFEYESVFKAENTECDSKQAFLVNAEYLSGGKKVVQGYDKKAVDIFVAAEGGSSDEEINLFAAYYDENGALISVEMSEHMLYANTLNYIVHNGSNADWTDVKTFLWKQNQAPLSDSVQRGEYMTKISVSDASLGNIYTDNRQVQFNITAQKGETIDYSVKDFWNNEVLSGEFKAEDNQFLWTLPSQQPGYFTIEFGYKNQETIKKIFCVVEEHDFKESGNPFFGVNAHLDWAQYGWKPEILDIIAIAGAKSIRTGHSWGSAETEKGVYKIPDTRYIDYIKKYNMTLNFTSGYNNKLYDGGMVPYSSDGAKAFAKYQLEVLKILGDTVTELDVYNEFYGGFGHLYGGGPARSQSKYYYQLLKESYDLIKPIYPNLQILATATNGSGYCGEENWYENLLKLGAAEKADGIFPHQYYTNKPPEEILSSYADFFEDNNKKYNSDNLKLYVTEYGASTYTGGVSEETAAKYAIRSNILWISKGAKKAYWYDFMDDGNSANDKEHNFGLVHSYTSPKGAYAPKPAYVAYAVMTRQLDGFDFKCLEQTADGIYIGRFENGSEKLSVVWATTGKNLNINISNGSITDIMGGEKDINGAVQLNINDEPIYIHGEWTYF